MLYYVIRALDFIAFRTTKRYNIIKIKSLAPNYYDKDTLLLHAVMQLVVDYVEIELVTEPDTKLKKLLNKLPWFLRPQFRSSKLGLINLDVLIHERSGPNFTDSDWLEFYLKLREIYVWWRGFARKSVEELSGFTAFIKNKNRYSKTYYHKKQKHIFDKLNKLELQYANEEANMLKAVIEYRNFLWT